MIRENGQFSPRDVISEDWISTCRLGTLNVRFTPFSAGNGQTTTGGGWSIFVVDALNRTVSTRPATVN